MGIADMPAGARRSLPLGAEPARSSVLGSYRSATFEFAPARFLDYARNDGVRERSAWLAGGRGSPLPILPKVSTGIADMPAGAPCHRRLARRGSLPAPTCPQGLPAGADLFHAVVLFVHFVVVAVEGSEGVEAAGEGAFGNGQAFVLFTHGGEVLQADDIDVIVEGFTDVAVEEFGEIIFVIAERLRNGIERDFFGVVGVDVRENIDDEFDAFLFDEFEGGVVRNEKAENHVDVAFFHERRELVAAGVKFGENAAELAVEFLVGKVRGKRVRLEKLFHVVGVIHRNDEEIFAVAYDRLERVHGVVMHENYIVRAGNEGFVLDLATHFAVEDIQNFYTAVEVRLRNAVHAVRSGKARVAVVEIFVCNPTIAATFAALYERVFERLRLGVRRSKSHFVEHCFGYGRRFFHKNLQNANK